MNETSTRVLIVDDHRMFADSLIRLLVDEDDLHVVGYASTIAEALRVAKVAHPDVVLLDFRLPDGDAPECVAHLRALVPDTRVLIMTGLNDDMTMRAASDVGCPVVTKDRAAAELIAALRLVAQGASDLAQDTRAALPRSARDRRGSVLTNRERDLLVELARGHSTAEIAKELHISPTTVRNHIQRMLAKLGAHSRLEAVAIAIEQGIITR